MDKCRKGIDETQKQVVGYVRVSTSEQVESGLSSQTRQIESYCGAKGLELRDVLADVGVSGGSLLATRPGGREVVRLVKAGYVSGVVSVRLDRAFRNVIDCLATVERWERLGVSLHIINLCGDSMDTKSAAGKFILTVLAAAAELERNLISERTKAAMKIKKDRGERYSQHTPFGFDLDSDGKMLTPNQAEQDVLGEMRDQRSKGWTYKRIAAELTQRGVRTKQGNQRWSIGSVSKMVTRC